MPQDYPHPCDKGHTVVVKGEWAVCSVCHRKLYHVGPRKK